MAERNISQSQLIRTRLSDRRGEQMERRKTADSQRSCPSPLCPWYLGHGSLAWSPNKPSSKDVLTVVLSMYRQFSLVDIATNLTHRFSVLSGLSVISFVSAPANESNRRPWSRVSRKRWHQSTLENEYAHSKTVWPVAQTEALFLPEFPVGIEEKLKLIFLGEISRGAFGQVFHVRCATTNKEYAMKVLSKSQVSLSK
nr:uncharacterized protein LOC113821546 [Penaeus vannamei]